MKFTQIDDNEGLTHKAKASAGSTINVSKSKTRQTVQTTQVVGSIKSPNHTSKNARKQQSAARNH